MSLNQPRLKAKIKAILDFEALQEERPDQSRERFADKLATAICEEIVEAKITYSNGLQAPNGAVYGTFNGGLS